MKQRLLQSSASLVGELKLTVRKLQASCHSTYHNLLFYFLYHNDQAPGSSHLEKLPAVLLLRLGTR